MFGNGSTTDRKREKIMLPKTYDPKPVEEKLICKWHKKRLFVSAIPRDKTKKPFVIVIPPPNITGALHMGHALNNTLQDVLVRYHRMRGKSVNWVPGTDHGGIATQNVIEKNLSREKKLHRHALGREKFLQYAWHWYKECGDTILSQLKKLGCALDLTPRNVRFTMDEKRTNAVMEAFMYLWNKKYIYRGKRMINWCVRCTTALSDIEVEHEEFKSKLYYVHYPAENGSEGITVATTRPETMFGDTALAVNPENKKYSRFIGKKLRLPLTDRLIPVIADKEIDLHFGTGALKITPAHDLKDYEIGKRHNLQTINTISPEGRMINTPKKYLGLSREQCRKLVLEDLKNGGYIKKEEPYKHAVGTCYRCHQPVEPAISEQWFVKMKDLAHPAIKTIENGKIEIHPESWKKPLLDWLANIEDWCISRQIWWGHRIPVWYCEKCNKAGLVYNDAGELVRVEFEKGIKPVLSVEKPGKCAHCGDNDFAQDPDVLDTWFSSGLWPFSVFDWPQKTKELEFFYPTSVLSTGYEILYLWVARMIMMGLKFLGEIPFSDIYLHGIIRDKTGKKMSKSLGNVIDPLDLMQKYGTDAVRFALVNLAYPGKDIPFDENSIIGARNFCNKIYNATRFLLMSLPKEPKVFKLPELTDLSDRWILEKYSLTVKNASGKLENFALADACNSLYHFLWGDYCDWYLELAKPRLQTQEKETVLAVLVNVLYGTLKALHPVMPFITEELAGSLKPYVCPDAKFLIDEKYPESKIETADTFKDMDLIMGVVTSIRRIRSLFHIMSGEKISVMMTCKKQGFLELIKKHTGYIKLLARIEHLDITYNLKTPPAHSATAISGYITSYISLKDEKAREKEKTRLEKELQKIEALIEKDLKLLKDENFSKNAPKVQQEKVRHRLSNNRFGQLEITTALKNL